MPKKKEMKFQWYFFITLALTSLVACSDNGKINFHDDSSNLPLPPTYRNADFNMVPASQALVVENVPTNGYQAKVQLNPQSGQILTGGGHKVIIKFTSRTR